jgi:hypothetical protein
MERTWLQLVRSCALQIVQCPNFGMGVTKRKQIPKGLYRRIIRSRGVLRKSED